MGHIYIYYISAYSFYFIPMQMQWLFIIVLIINTYVNETSWCCAWWFLISVISAKLFSPLCINIVYNIQSKTYEIYVMIYQECMICSHIGYLCIYIYYTLLTNNHYYNSLNTFIYAMLLIRHITIFWIWKIYIIIPTLEIYMNQ